jgi:hypothetical protein
MNKSKYYNINIYFVGAILVMFVLENFHRAFFIKELTLTADAVPKLWQFITYSFYTGLDVSAGGFGRLNAVFFLFHVLIAFWFGRLLEAYLGSLKYLAFIVLTIAGEGIVAYLLGEVNLLILFGRPVHIQGLFSLSFLFMVGLTHPEEEIYVFFIFRVKIIYLSVFLYIVTLTIGSYSILSKSIKGILMIASLVFGSLAGVIVFKVWGYVFSALRKKRKEAKYSRIEARISKNGERASDAFSDIKDKLERGSALSSDDYKYIEEIKSAVANGELCGELDFEPESSTCKTCEDFKTCIKRFFEKHNL